ncbi:MAG: hypothetical protein J6P31_01975 [Oscillospiraceae bacterium]|nr:hypothetical protein [Oscillospiraceae bacterium]
MRFPLLPTYILPALTDITPAFLSEEGIDLLIMDFDNTIVPYTTSEPAPVMEEWIRSLPKLGIPFCVVSNSRKPRVVRFCSQYSIPVFTNAKKPFTKGIRQALAAYPDSVCPALVGDQIYTDVLGAGLAGIRSVLITPIHLHKWYLRLRHWVEIPWIQMKKCIIRRRR